MVVVPYTASAVPQQPMQFHGNVSINGAAAPDGIEIDAKIDGITYQTTFTFTNSSDVPGRYGDNPFSFQIPADDGDTVAKEGGVNGDQVDFYVGDQFVTSAVFQIGSAGNILDLTIAGALPVASAPTNTVQYTAINVDPPTMKWSAPTSTPGGVKSYEINVNDGDWTNIGSGTQYTIAGAVGDGDHTFNVRAIDLFDAAGATGSINFSIDTTAVGAVSGLARTSAASDNTPTFTWDAAAQAALYEIKMDSGAWTDVANVLTYTHSTALDDGTHTFSVRAKDSAGNAGPADSLSDFIIDVTLPSRPTDTAKTTPDNDTTPTFTWTASADATSGLDNYEYKIDDGSWTSTLSAAATYTHGTVLDYGTHIFYVRAKDASGNLSASDYVLFTLTSTVADTVIIVSRTTADNDNTPTFTWNDVIGVNDYQVRLDGGEWSAALGDVTVYTYPSAIADGTHAFYVWEVGSFGTTAGNVTFFIDGTGPTTPSNLTRTTAANNNTPSFTWTHSTDARTGVDTYEMKLDAGEWTDIGYVNNYSYSSAITDGSHVLYVRAKDGAGNHSASAIVSFSVETVAPVVTVASPNGGEYLKGGTATTIEWTTVDSNRGTVKIEYSTNSGTSWNTIVASTADTGSYEWTVPAINVNTAMVKIIATDMAANIGSDTSGADFTIDSTAPVISGISVPLNAITQTSARIDWVTDEVATTQIEFGTTDSYGSTTTLDTSLSTDHAQTLTGLTPGTLYHYRVISEDRVGNQSVSVDATFTTDAVSVSVAISNVDSSGLTPYSATVSWDTDVAADSQVEYGTTAAYGSTTAFDSTTKTAHSVAVSGLQANTEYHYRVLSGGAVSADNTFTTAADGTAPVISSVASGGVTASTASVTWNTDEMATSQVVYSTTSFTGTDYATGALARTAYGSFTAEDASLVLGHGVGIAGLSTSTTYYYRAVSKDGAGNETVSDEGSFTTLADTTDPVISDIRSSSITTNSAIVLWLTNELATTQVYYDAASHVAGVPGDYASSTQLVSTLSYGHGAAVAGLSPNTTYYYRTVSKDANNNEIVSSEQSFTTNPDGTAPAITGVTEANIGATSAIVLWLTNEDATSNLVYDVFSGSSAGAYALSAPTVADTTADSMNHSVAISSLVDATTYYYRVLSKDAAGNETVSEEYSFTTGDGTAPAVSNINGVAITSTAAGIVWSTDEGATTQVVYNSITSHSGETYADAAAARDAYGSFSTENVTLRNGHGVILTGLTSGQTYYYRVISRDGSGNETISAEISFITT